MCTFFKNELFLRLPSTSYHDLEIERMLRTTGKQFAKKGNIYLHWRQTHGRWSTLSIGSDCAWIASIAVECSNSRFFPVESSARRRAAALLCDALSPAAAAAAAAEDLEGLLPFSSASSLAAFDDMIV